MNLFSTSDLEYPFTVTVYRPQGEFGEDGSYHDLPETIIENMTADIQLSLKVRTVKSEDKTGISDATAWIMFCDPPVPIQAGDRVYDGTRTFVVDAANDWGTHTECVMSIVTGTV